MRQNFKYFIAIFIIIIAAIILVLLNKSRNSSSQSFTEDGAVQKESNINTNIEPTSSKKEASTSNNLQNVQELQLQTTNSRLEKLKSILESKDAPVRFYGHVVDQESNGITDVQILMRVRQWGIGGTFDTWGNKFPKFNRVTDSNGNFSLENVSGDSLTFESITKEGYRLSPKTLNGYGFGNVSNPFHPDQQNPMIIKMWKLGESAQLISQDKDARIPYDGTSVVFDLLTGQKNVGDSATGDLRVTLIRNPLNIQSGYRNAFEWHATIEAIDGGLIQSDDDFMYEAPEEGYQPKIQIDMPADASNWANIYDISFYAKTRGGEIYSRVKFEFRVDSPKPETGFTITSAANPTGSRNLEPK